MPRVDIENLPDHARVWLFAASRDLEPEERDGLLAGVDVFLDTWAAHGKLLTGARDWRYERFLIVAVDEEAAGVSGCSIDALTRMLRDVEGRFGIELLNNAPILFRRGDTVERISREQFGELARSGDVPPETVVFDNTVATLGAIRAGKWETAARNSWHGHAFFDLARPSASAK